MGSESTSIVNSSDDIAVKLWEGRKLLYKDVLKQSRLGSMVSSSGTNVVHLKSMNASEAGDVITFPIRFNNNTNFLPENAKIEDNLDKMHFGSFKLTLTSGNLGISGGTDISKARNPYDENTELRAAAVDAGANALSNAMIAELLNTSQTSAYLYFAGSDTLQKGTVKATCRDLITGNDLVTPERLSKAKSWAIANRVNDRVVIEPILWNGNYIYPTFISQNVINDLKQDTTYFAAIQNALPRDSNNPIFTGAVGLWDGLLLLPDDRLVDYEVDNSSNIRTSDVIICGKQALCYGIKGMPEILIRAVDAFDEQYAAGYKSIYGLKKPMFSKNGVSHTFGSVNVLFATSNTVNA